MALNFPNSPSLNDIHNENGTRWQWNGESWTRIVTAGSQGFQGATGATGAQGDEDLLVHRCSRCNWICARVLLVLQVHKAMMVQQVLWCQGAAGPTEALDPLDPLDLQEHKVQRIFGSTGQQVPKVLLVHRCPGAEGSFGGATFYYTFESNTNNAQPGAGDLRLDNATQNTSTGIYIDDTGKNGNDISSFLQTIDDSTSTLKGVKISNKLDPSQFIIFTISV